MIFFNFYLTTLAFVNGENNGFTTNDWQEKHIIVYLIDFAWFLPEANFVRGTFEYFPVSDKILKKARQTIRIICLALMMTENLSQLINNFFANEKRPYLFNRFLNTLVGLRSVDN